MTTYDAAFWERFQKASGKLGAVAFILVVFASRMNGGFDWKVFGLSVTALFLAWANSWTLVPLHLRHEDAEKEEWDRFLNTDWRFVDSLSGLSGAEIDEMRAIFREGDDNGAREMIRAQWPAMTQEDVGEFVRFFNNQFMDTISAWIDENGRLQPFT